MDREKYLEAKIIWANDALYLLSLSELPTTELERRRFYWEGVIYNSEEEIYQIRLARLETNCKEN